MIITGLIYNGIVHFHCGHCHYYIGSSDAEHQWKEWNYCPFCGEPLYETLTEGK